jgi:hypothetical protein
MAVKLYIKTSKPFTEKLVQAAGVKDNITLGIKAYSNTEVESIRKDFQQAIDTTKITRYIKELEVVKEDNDLSYEQIDLKVIELNDLIDKANEVQKYLLQDFYKSHILYIKNASLSTEDSEGKVTDLLIPDTRDVKPIESLWEDVDSCLVVLLDMYLDSPFFRDSLIQAITESVFHISLKDSERKN